MEGCQVEELDEEFRRGLISVRPYIERLASPEDGRLCREWLERLHCWEGERTERNRLLAELVTHVRSGLLGYPFTQPPAPQQEAFIGPKYERVQGTYTCNSCPESDCPEDSLKFPFEEAQSNVEELADLGRRMSEPPSLNHWARQNPQEETDIIPYSSDNVMGEDDCIYSLQNTISSLQAQNEALVREVQLYRKTSQRTQQNLNKVNGEVMNLKAKLREAERTRSLERSEVKVLEGYKRSLDEGLAQLATKLQETADHSLAGILAAIVPHTQKSESMFKREIEELKNQLSSERVKSQNKIKNLEFIIAKKNEQLEKVDLQVKKQCNEMQQEVCHIKSEIGQVATEGQQQLRSKILNLKQDVSRLEKANKKLVGEYEQRLEECKKEQKQKKGGTILLTRNRGDMGQLERSVVELEERYRKIVADIEARAAGQRRRDLQRIQELEEKLLSKDTKNI